MKLETIKDPSFFGSHTFSTLDFGMILGMPINDEQNKKLNTVFKQLLDFFMTPKFIESIGSIAHEVNKKRAIEWLKAMEYDGSNLPLEIFKVTKTNDCMSAKNWIRHFYHITPEEELK